MPNNLSEIRGGGQGMHGTHSTPRVQEEETPGFVLVLYFKTIRSTSLNETLLENAFGKRCRLQLLSGPSY